MGDCHSWHYMVMLSKPSARKKSGPVETGLTRLAAMALHSLTLSFPSHIKLSKLLTSIFSSQLTHGEGPKKI